MPFIFFFSFFLIPPLFKIFLGGKYYAKYLLRITKFNSMLDGNCRTIRLAVLGDETVPKSAVLRRWKHVPNFDKLFAGSPAPDVPTDEEIFPDHEQCSDLPSSLFTRYECMDIVIQHCVKAAAHRVFCIDAPPLKDRAVLYRGLLERANGSIEGGADGVIVFCDASTDDDVVVDYLDACEQQNCHVLLLHSGDRQLSAKVLERIDGYAPSGSRKQQSITQSLARRRPGSSSRRPITHYNDLLSLEDLRRMQDDERDRVLKKANGNEKQRVMMSPGTVRYIAVSDFHSRDNFLEISAAFIRLVQDVHDALELAEAHLARLNKDFEELQRADLMRTPPVPLPPASSLHNCAWHDEHHPHGAHSIECLVWGASNTGKTTFVTALVDGFVLRQHVPTTEFEVAHLSLALGEAAERVVNLTFFDGLKIWNRDDDNEEENVHISMNRYPSSVICVGVVLTFLDVTDPYGVERWKESLAALPVPRPPHLGILAVKNDLLSSSLFSTDSIMDLAGKHGAFFQYIDPRSTSQNRALVAQLVTHILLQQEHTKVNLERQRLIHSKKPHEIPHSVEDVDILFHQFDTAGTGFITVEEAEHVLRAHSQVNLFNADGFAKLVSHMVAHCGPLARSRENKQIKLLSKDQFAVMLCKVNKL